jgi:hypothetical protein
VTKLTFVGPVRLCWACPLGVNPVDQAIGLSRQILCFSPTIFVSLFKEFFVYLFKFNIPTTFTKI